MLRCADRKTRNSRTWSLPIPFYEFHSFIFYFFYFFYFLVERGDEQVTYTSLFVVVTPLKIDS